MLLKAHEKLKKNLIKRYKNIGQLEQVFKKNHKKA